MPDWSEDQTNLFGGQRPFELRSNCGLALDTEGVRRSPTSLATLPLVIYPVELARPIFV